MHEYAHTYTLTRSLMCARKHAHTRTQAHTYALTHAYALSHTHLGLANAHSLCVSAPPSPFLPSLSCTCS